MLSGSTGAASCWSYRRVLDLIASDVSTLYKMIKPYSRISFRQNLQLWNETRDLRLKIENGHSSDFVFRCQLNDAFGLILQGILAFTAFCILIGKFLYC